VRIRHGDKGNDTEEGTPQIPASILQFHDNVTVLIDEAAASML
jgi:6-phosphogluconolactonase/glucosamine-6-phosphate isomerase/deaminase